MSDLVNYWDGCTPTLNGADVGVSSSANAWISWSGMFDAYVVPQGPVLEIDSTDGLFTLIGMLPCCPAAVGPMDFVGFVVNPYPIHEAYQCVCFPFPSCPKDAGPPGDLCCDGDIDGAPGSATVNFTSVTGSLEGTIEYTLAAWNGYDGGLVMTATFSIPIDAYPVVPYDGGRCPTDPTLTEYQPCGKQGFDSETPANTPFDGCSCGQVCAYDPYFQKIDPMFEGTPVCETPCTSDADCDSSGGLKAVCTPLHGTATPGSVCMLPVCPPGSAGQSCGSPSGTCVPQPGSASDGGADALVCTDSCVSATCLDTCGPILTAHAGEFCFAGGPCVTLCGLGETCQAISDGGGACRMLCSTETGTDPCCPTCYNPTYCIVQDPGDTSWGYCAPCGSSGDDGGSPSNCIVDADCCEANCIGKDGGRGVCGP